jgi:predicted Zn-dependent protease
MPAARKEDVLSVLSQIASNLRTQVGESLATVKQHDAPLPEVTTSSLEALKAFGAGKKLLYSSGQLSAIPLLKRAVERDPKFASAWALLGRMYAYSGQGDLTIEALTNAWQLRDRASDPEKFFIDANYYIQVKGNAERARQTCELWAQSYPRDNLAFSMLSGIVYNAVGQTEKATEAGRKSIEIDPDFAVVYGGLAYAYVYLDRLAEAESVIQMANDRKLRSPDLLLLPYDLAFLKRDTTRMNQAAAVAMTKIEDQMSDRVAHVSAYFGQLQAAEKASRHAADLAMKAEQPEGAASYETPLALWQALFERGPEARRTAAAALALSKSRDVQFGAAFALALSGDSSGAQMLADGLAQHFPQDTSVQYTYLPSIRARLALNAGDTSKAIELLKTSIPYERALTSSGLEFFGVLYPVYVRGEAYLAAGKGSEAAAEFQKILDHPGLIVSDPIGALAHLQLGRALAISGDKIKAKAAYKDFFTLWNEADPELPILKRAQGEFKIL